MRIGTEDDHDGGCQRSGERTAARPELAPGRARSSLRHHPERLSLRRPPPCTRSLGPPGRPRRPPGRSSTGASRAHEHVVCRSVRLLVDRPSAPGRPAGGAAAREPLVRRPAARRRRRRPAPAHRPARPGSHRPGPGRPARWDDSTTLTPRLRDERQQVLQQRPPGERVERAPGSSRTNSSPPLAAATVRPSWARWPPESLPLLRRVQPEPLDAPPRARRAVPPRVEPAPSRRCSPTRQAPYTARPGRGTRPGRAAPASPPGRPPQHRDPPFARGAQPDRDGAASTCPRRRPRQGPPPARPGPPASCGAGPSGARSACRDPRRRSAGASRYALVGRVTKSPVAKRASMLSSSSP